MYKRESYRIKQTVQTVYLRLIAIRKATILGWGGCFSYAQNVLQAVI